MHLNIRSLLITILFIQKCRNTLEVQLVPRQGESDESKKTDTTTETKPKNKDMNRYNWNKFEPPPDVEDWKSWVVRYNKSMEDKAKASGDYGADKPVDTGEDWPEKWIGFGVGTDGVSPPPWASVPKNMNRASFCFLQLDPGECNDAEYAVEGYRKSSEPKINNSSEINNSQEINNSPEIDNSSEISNLPEINNSSEIKNLSAKSKKKQKKKPESSIRWAFNPYIEDCVQFTYSGCYGNQNNFLTKLKCLQSCNEAQEKGCDSNSHIQERDLNVRRKCGLTLTDQELFEKTGVEYYLNF